MGNIPSTNQPFFSAYTAAKAKQADQADSVGLASTILQAVAVSPLPVASVVTLLSAVPADVVWRVIEAMVQAKLVEEEKSSSQSMLKLGPAGRALAKVAAKSISGAA